MYGHLIQLPALSTINYASIVLATAVYAGVFSKFYGATRIAS